MAIRPRIMLVGQMPPTKGGITTFMLNLMASYLAKDFEFIPYSVSRPPKKNVIDNWGYGAVLRGGLGRILYGIALTIYHLFLFPFVLAIQKIDLVQIQASDYQVFWEAIAYVLLARMLGRPVLLRIGGAFDLFHGGSPPGIKRIIAMSLRLPQYVIVQSRFAYSYVKAIGRTTGTVILPNWTEERIVARVPPRSKEHPIFLFIASNEARRKGVEEVLDAMCRLDAMGSSARFHLVALVPQLIERIEKMKPGNVAALEGMLAHKRLLEIMRSADVFLLPSHGEGFPNSLIEAMAAGMASIVTPVAAVPEIVAEGGAIIIPVGDAEALAAAIDKLTTNPDLRQKLGSDAQAIIQRKFTPEKTLSALAEAYWHLLKG